MKIIIAFFVTICLLLACSDSPFMQGKRLYTAKCQNCHMEDGSGLSKLIPNLNKSKYLGQPAIVCLLKSGIQDTIWQDSTYLIKSMPSFSKLSATEVTNILNYISHRWSPNFSETHIVDVENALKLCK